MQRGYTLLELVAVMVMLAALAVVAMPRLQLDGHASYRARQEIFAALRHAQKTAISSGCGIEVELDAAADRYRIEYRPNGTDNVCGTDGDKRLLRPGGAGDLSQRPVPGGIQTGGHIVIDSLGLPRDPDDLGAHLALQAVLEGGHHVVMEAHTGYIHD